MFKYLAVILVLVGVCFADTSTIIPFPGVPTGHCAPTKLGLNLSNGDLYSCNNGTWKLSGGGSGTVGPGTVNAIAKFTGTTAVGDSLATDNGTSLAYSGTGGITATSDGTHAGQVGVVGNTTVPTSLGSNNFNWIGPNSASFTSWGIQMPSAENSAVGLLVIGIPSSHIAQATIGTQYVNGDRTVIWGGSGTSFALTSGDDAIANNALYNPSSTNGGVTRTITSISCSSDDGSNTTTINPTFGATGTGTTILSGAMTCGSSTAMSTMATGCGGSACTVSGASWVAGTGIKPIMGGTLTGKHITMQVNYTF